MRAFIERHLPPETTLTHAPTSESCGPASSAATAYSAATARLTIARGWRDIAAWQGDISVLSLFVLALSESKRSRSQAEIMMNGATDHPGLLVALEIPAG